MANQNQDVLDEFRKKWQNELQSRNSIPTKNVNKREKAGTGDHDSNVKDSEVTSGHHTVKTNNEDTSTYNDNRNIVYSSAETSKCDANVNDAKRDVDVPLNLRDRDVCMCSKRNEDCLTSFRIADDLLSSTSSPPAVICNYDERLANNRISIDESSSCKYKHTSSPSSSSSSSTDNLKCNKVNARSKASDVNVKNIDNGQQGLLCSSLNTELCNICKKPKRHLPEDFSASFVRKRSLKSAYKIDVEQYKLSKRLKLKDSAEPKSNETNNESFLDSFLADLDEINEIPFFDISIPKEIAVKMFIHLDMISLCRCAQVSRSWKQIAEDELLWCRICHDLGYDSKVNVVDRSHWKEIVKTYILTEKLLDYNWKNRIGRIFTSQLDYTPGGVLCAAHSVGTSVLSGYTSGEVRMYDLTNQEGCTFNPSSRALNLDHENGTVANTVTSVAICDSVLCAGYQHGFVDIWSRNKGTYPIHTFCLPQAIKKVALTPCGRVLAACAGQQVHMESLDPTDQDGNNGCLGTQKFCLGAQVNHMKFTTVTSNQKDAANVLLLSTQDTVYAHRHGYEVDAMSTLHCIIGEDVTCIDSSPEVTAVGVSAFGGFVSDLFRVKLYRLETGQEMEVLRGHSWKVTAINLHSSPANMLVTGSGDKVVRLYDMRLAQAAMSLRGHSGAVTLVQMDEWKVVSGGNEGVVAVWDQRMASKLWEIYNRHPVDYLNFNKNLLIAANVPSLKFPQTDESDPMLHRRHRGHLTAYDFHTAADNEDILNICKSTYDEPQGYNYNIGLMTPYD